MGGNQLAAIDSIATAAIKNKATPGCVVLVLQNSRIAYYKSFGHLNYDSTESTRLETVYDMASVTKICATTIAVMKLYEQGILQLDKTLGDYLPVVEGTNKAKLTIRDILLHQAGLVAYIPFYKEIIDTTGRPDTALFAAEPKANFTTRVAKGLYQRNDWKDTMMQRIMQSPLGARGKYVYSDNDFILLGKIVEELSGMTLDAYVQKHFYKPMALSASGFKPLERMQLKSIAPSEQEPIFRKQLIRGDVHDPGAAMFGGVAGHAGLFSNAYDMAAVMQMLLNGGEFNGRRYLNKSTIDYFTAYQSAQSRRGLGFDKPEKDNVTRKEPYPCASASPQTFGHTGFTGTCVWADPVYNLVYVFVSNRLTPDGTNNKLSRMNVRTEIQEAIYKALRQ